MSRLGFLFCLPFSVAGLAWGQQRRPTPPPEPDEPEEAVEPEFAFNPIQAQKEMQIGDFYSRRKSYRAAAARYERATKWQPDLAEAYFKLGESREKLDQPEAALAAYQKYLELAPSARKAAAVKKKIAQLQNKTAKPDAAPDQRTPRPAPRPF